MKEISLNSMTALLALHQSADEYYFRGQRDPNWLITPSIYRSCGDTKLIEKLQENTGIKKLNLDTKILREINYLAKQESNYHEFKAEGGDRNIDLIIWAYQQHHGPGTIYIDWTHCFATGLFFAIFPDKEIYKKHCSFKHYFESDYFQNKYSNQNIAIYAMPKDLVDVCDAQSIVNTGLKKIDPSLCCGGWKRMLLQSGILVHDSNNYSLEDNVYINEPTIKYVIPAQLVARYLLELNSETVDKLNEIATDLCCDEEGLEMQDQMNQIVESIFKEILDGKLLGELPTNIPKTSTPGKFDPNGLVQIAKCAKAG